jgi:16S rRNA (guanine(966)-N(2))-methyltransferase RsmD
MSIRVIAGSAKGRRLKLVPGESTRPIMDRVKQALFNILGDAILEARVLDLFAGTGGVGIEALSRGAAYAEFVESGRVAVNIIRENLHATGLLPLARIIRSDVFIHLRNAPREGFDYVHIAPPQYRGLWSKTLQALEAKPEWVNPDGIVCVQIDPREYQAQKLAHFTLVDERNYANTRLCLYERQSLSPA